MVLRSFSVLIWIRRFPLFQFIKKKIKQVIEYLIVFITQKFNLKIVYVKAFQKFNLPAFILFIFS